MFEIENVKALRYANAFSLLLSPPVMLIICRKYFFPKQPQPRFEKVMFLPALVLFVIFLLRVTGILVLSEIGKALVIWGAFAVFLVFFAMTVNMGVKIKKLADGVDYLEYSDSVDFSHTFGNYVMRIPTLICIVAAINYLFNDPWVKFSSDIFSTIMTVAFVLFTLDPWREIEFVEEKRTYNEFVEATENKSKRRMSDARFEVLRDELLKLFEEKEIFLTPQLSLDVLLKELSTNRNYLGETIARCGYKSFYDMVNSYRVKYAIALIKEESQIKMVEVAYRSGFASATSMNKAFASQGMAVPSQHRNIVAD
jgi:AraC-like DNA-binding protein